MNRTTLNRKARDKIAQICRDLDWRWCQAQLPGCMGEAHGPAHRHKRRWYYDKPDSMLWDVTQWIPACQSCHTKMEHDKKLTEQLFNDKR